MTVEELPCRHRNLELPNGRYGCGAHPTHLTAPDGVTLLTCSMCWYRNRDLPVLPNPPQSKGPCRNLGLSTGETVECKECKGTVRLKLMTCDIHGICTVRKKLEGVASCEGCKDYVEVDRV